VDLALKGKKAIVTGGTRGIGRAIAEALAAEGTDIAICARNHGEIDEAVTALSRRGVKAWGSPVDVADSKALRAWVGEAAGALGGIDIFIANVSALAVTADEAAWRKSFDVDVMGTVVVIGSVAAAEVTGPTRPYNAVKAALVPYVKSLAQNLARKNIRVNTVSPGTIYFKGGIWHQREQQMPDFFKGVLARNPTGRMGTPEEVAAAVVFLASARASYITGANLVVDGAITQRVQF
jgi:3-oxoacyl-[acyl-carrier protein] reductase